ncbi:hypothetical protein EDB89DRAFT_652979 [Lactarius sanguifluus]|nr:hypothetical protein EDB89DRAFT_652979 [Lactarius sanguifluus]
MHLPFPAAHTEILFWDLRWRKWCRLCRWPAPWVGLSDLCAHGCALSCQLPLTRHIGRAFNGLWKDDWRTVSESVRRVCYTRHSLPLGVFSLCTSRSLFTACACVGNYIGFGHGHLGLFLSTLHLYRTDVNHPLDASGSSSVLCHFGRVRWDVGTFSCSSASFFRPIRLDIRRFRILPARRYAPLSLMSPPSRSTSRRFSPQLLGICGRTLCGPRGLYGI